MQIQRADNTALYVKDMYKAAFMGYAELKEKRSSIFTIVNSAQGAGEKETQILEIDQLDRHTVEGQDINFEGVTQGWETYCKYQTYSKGISLSFEADEDSVKIRDVLKKFAQRLGRASQYTKEVFAARVFNNGGVTTGDWIFNGTHTGNTDPSGDLVFDSKPFFNLGGNLRTTKGGGTYYNSVASINLTYANFRTIYNLHVSTNNRDELDRPVPNPADTLIVRPGADEAAAKEILLSKQLPDGNFNNMNPSYNVLDKIVAWDYLTDVVGSDYPFYIGKRNHPDIEFRQRQFPKISYFIDHNNASPKAYYIERFGIWIKANHGGWRAFTRGGGSSS